MTHTRNLHGAILAIALAGMLAGGCAVNPVTGKAELSLISRDSEIAMGTKAAPEFEKEFGGAVGDAKLQAYVREVGGRVAAQSDRPMPYEFTLVRSKTPNAFALPGGKVFITAGLMALMDNERQLAAVLGHEIGHISAKHNVKGMQRQIGVTLLAKIAGAAAGATSEQVTKVVGGMTAMKYGRDDEFQADQLGLTYMARAGYNPFGMVELLELLLSLREKEPSKLEAMFSTHPLSSDRVARAKDLIQSNHASARPDAKDTRALYFQAWRQRLITLVPEVR